MKDLYDICTTNKQFYKQCRLDKILNRKIHSYNKSIKLMNKMMKYKGTVVLDIRATDILLENYPNIFPQFNQYCEDCLFDTDSDDSDDSECGKMGILYFIEKYISIVPDCGYHDMNPTYISASTLFNIIYHSYYHYPKYEIDVTYD